MDTMCFIFTEPSFIKNKENIKTRENMKSIKLNKDIGNEYNLKLKKNEMTRCAITLECTEETIKQQKEK